MHFKPELQDQLNDEGDCADRRSTDNPRLCHNYRCIIRNGCCVYLGWNTLAVSYICRNAFGCHCAPYHHAPGVERKRKSCLWNPHLSCKFQSHPSLRSHELTDMSLDQLSTMVALTIAALVAWVRSGNAQIHENWVLGQPGSASGIAKQIFYGFCLGILGLTGFECKFITISFDTSPQS